MGILDSKLKDLYNLLKYSSSYDKLNNSNIIHFLITDLCENSSPENGLCFSDNAFNLLNQIKDFNYKNIYLNNRMEPSIKFFKLVLNEIYDKLKSCFDEENTIDNVKNLQKFYSKLGKGFYDFLSTYANLGNREDLKLKNKIVFNILKQEDFSKAILSYISGMTDNFAIEIYNEIIRF